MSAGSEPRGRRAWRRRFRLSEEYQFERIRRQGRCIPNACFLLCYAPNGLGHPRFGFVVSRRLGKAALRNKVRRWLRESVRELLPSISGGWDIVFIAKKPIVEAGFGGVSAAIREALGSGGPFGHVEGASGSAARAD